MRGVNGGWAEGPYLGRMEGAAGQLPRFRKLLTSLLKSGILSIFFLVADIDTKYHHHGQTMHPTEIFILMNLFKILCILT